MLSLIAITIGFLSIGAVFDIYRKREIHDIFFIMWALSTIAFKVYSWFNMSITDFKVDIVSTVIITIGMALLMIYPWKKNTFIGQGDILGIMILSFGFANLEFLAKWFIISSLLALVYSITSAFHNSISGSLHNKVKWKDVLVQEFAMFPFFLLGFILSVI